MNQPLLNSRLKEETKKAHQELEKKVISKLKAIRTEAHYADFLNSFYNYFSGVESLVSQHINTDILPDYAVRRNSGRLKEDIAELGFQISPLTEKPMPEITSLPAAIGAMYVMEGSIMGGPIIVEMLKKYGIKRGFSFFSGYGAETGKMWATFMTFMNNNTVTETEQQIAINVASQTFARFQYYF